MTPKGYKKISEDLIRKLEEREKEIIIRRYGLQEEEPETLQSIGDSLGITRERVRQIQELAKKKIKPELERFRQIFDEIIAYFKEYGGARKEETMLKEIGGKERNNLLFLLDLYGKFLRINQDKNFHTFWALDQRVVEMVKKTISLLCKKLEKEKKLMSFEELSGDSKTENKFLLSCLEISKRIQQNQKGLYGLKEWPEINPRGVRDKAYLLLKELQKPLHFSEVAKLINGANVATVHNELIKDERFVLVGRGIYALKEWGYYPGQVRDVILKILKEERRPLTKEEILEKVKQQRIVKETTVFLNLSNRKYFIRDKEGKYRIKTAEI